MSLHEAAQRALEWASGDTAADRGQPLTAGLVLRETVAPLDVVDDVLDALDGHAGRRPPTPWLLEAVGRQTNPWSVDDDGRRRFKGRACCADVIERVRTRFTRRLLRPPVIFECPGCHATFEVSIGTMRAPHPL